MNNTSITERGNILNEDLHWKEIDCKALRLIGIAWGENGIRSSVLLLQNDKDKEIYGWRVEHADGDADPADNGLARALKLAESRIFETLEAAKAFFKK
jgi:hypothetical protein